MKRVTQLDGVRGIAILLVLIWHYVFCQISWHFLVWQISPESKRILGYCMRAISATWSGVDLFFVLSGFLIAGVLLDHRDTSNYFRVFYLRRICRIFPLYFLLLGLFVCVGASPVSAAPRFLWVFANPMPIWSYATFTQNIFMGIRSDFGSHWLGITWSLAIEEQFYLVLPLLIYLLPRRSILLSSFLAAVLAAPVLRYVSPGLHAVVDMPWRADSLLSGASLALLVRWHPFLSAVRRARRLLLAIFVTLLLGTVAMIMAPTAGRWLLGAIFGHFWLACLYSAFILVAFADTEPHLGRLLRSRVLVWFGNLSYAIYMFHEGVSGVLYGLFRSGPPEIRTPSDAWITLMALCATLLLALLSYRFFEGPILRLGHRARYSPQPSSTADMAARGSSIT